jgi:ABC-type lipoprotein release transport system permease subunit
MGFAGFIMILFATLMAGFIKNSEQNAVAMDLGDIQIHAQGYRDDPDLYTRIMDAETLVKEIQGKGFYATERLYGFGLAAAESTSAGIQLRGVDLKNEATVTQIHQHVMRGDWLSDTEPKGVVIGRKLARTLGVQPGDDIVVLAQAADGSMANDLYVVRGILKSVGEVVDRSGFFMLEKTFRELMVLFEGAHEIAIMRPDRRTHLEAVESQIAALAEDYETLTWRQLKPTIARLLETANVQIMVMILITYIAVATVVLNAMLMSVFERIRELGIMKAVGVKPFQIIRLIYIETLVQVIVAGTIALVSGWLASAYFQKHGIDLSSVSSGASFGGVALDPVWRSYITGEALAMPIIMLFVIAAIAVIYPAFKAAFIQPVKAIHYR